MACSCETCEQKRTLFSTCINEMAGGIGHAKKTMQRRISTMPENFISDLRQLLRHLRQSPEVAKQLTPLQQRILKAHRLPLRRFTAHDPRLLLLTKRRVDGSRIPLAQAIGSLLGSNSKLIKDYVNAMESH
jgi:hypothetical protein